MLDVGPFELRGLLHINPGEPTQLPFLLRSATAFFPLTQTTLRCLYNPAIDIGPITTLVQRDQVVLLTVVS